MTTADGSKPDLNVNGNGSGRGGFFQIFKNALLSGLGLRIFLSFGALMFVALLVLPAIFLFGLPFTDFDGAYHENLHEKMGYFSLVADMKKNHLIKWISERRGDARLISRSRIIRSNIEKLLNKMHKHNLTKIDRKTLAGILLKEPEYHGLSDYLKSVKTSYVHYSDIHIADADTGIIIVSTMPEEVGGDICVSETDKAAPKKDFIEDIGFMKDPSDGDINLVITRRIDTCVTTDGPCGQTDTGQAHADRLGAILMTYSEIEDAVKPILQTGEGLGETGDIVLVDGNRRLLATLKYPLADGTTAKPLEYRLNTLPASLAAAGNEGTIVAADYRGKQVLATYRHLRITPDVGLGMVVKVDMDEVYAPRREFIIYFALISAFSLIMFLAITYYVSRKISRPIKELSATAKLISGGNLSARAAVRSTSEATDAARGEMEILTETFNDMVDRLENQQKYLETKVSEEVAARRKQEQILIQQSKLASMGEMMQAIAHQWRQPLNAVGIMIQDLKDAHDHNELTPEYVEENIKNAMSQLHYMSKTIDDFRNFFKPSKKKIPFNVTNEVKNAMSLLSAQLAGSYIEVSLKNSITDDNAITGYPNEFIQVLVNIINNARDAILKKRSKGLYADGGGRISINTSATGEYVRIDINNDGGAIPEKIMGKIFDPYFTTKFASAGTGIGLYMSKVIIENNMGGKLYAENTGDGVTFTVKLRK